MPIAPPFRRTRSISRAASRLAITEFPVDVRRRVSGASSSGLSSGRAMTSEGVPSAPVPSAAHSQFPRCAVRNRTPRPLDNPLLDAPLTRLRTSTGNSVIAKRDAAREMLRVLRKGGAIGILNDQHARPPDAVTAPFFGQPAATSSALAKLADRTEALVIPAAAIRIAPARWRLTFEPALDVRELSEAERGFEKLTARLNGILETMIRRHPEQWLWLHNRWRLDEGLDSPSE